MDRALRVLVVEDEEDLVELLRFNLRGAGYEPVTARTAREALRIAESEGVDAVILDLMLPDLPGTEVCRRLRATTNARGACPSIMLTAKGEEIDRVVGFELGADDYVVKPFSVRELLLRIERRAAPRPRRRRGATAPSASACCGSTARRTASGSTRRRSR